MKIEQPIKEFTTDRCSGRLSWFLNKILGLRFDWELCCETHDHAYWQGGTKKQRKAADREMRLCIIRIGGSWYHWLLAGGMWLAVRACGHPLFTANWRWGFAYRYRLNFGHLVKGGSCYPKSEVLK